MECTLATLIACFNLSGLYIDTGLQFQDTPVPRIEWYETVYVHPRVTEVIRTQEIVARRENPYGRVALGYAIEFRQVSLSLEMSHVSSLATGQDRGVNAVQLRARWFPFR